MVFFTKIYKFFLTFLIFSVVFFLASKNSNHSSLGLYNLNVLVKGISPFAADKDFSSDSFGDSDDIANLNRPFKLSNKYFDYIKYIYSIYKSAKNVTKDVVYTDEILKRLENNRIDIIKFFGNMNIQIKFNYCNFFKSLIDYVSLDVDNAFDKTTNIDECILEYDMFQNVNSLQDIHNNLVSRGYLGESNPLVKDELLNKYFEKFNEYYKNFKSICYKDDNIQVSDENVSNIVFNSSNLVCYCNFMITLFSYIYSDPVFILNYVIKRFCELVIPDFSYNYSITEVNKKEKTKKNEEASDRIFDKLRWFSKIFDYCDENSSVDLFTRNEQEEECPSDSKLFELFLHYKNGPIQSIRCLSDIIDKKKYLDKNLIKFLSKMHDNVLVGNNAENNAENNALFSFLRNYLDLFLVKLKYFYNFICWNKLFFKWARFADAKAFVVNVDNNKYTITINRDIFVDLKSLLDKIKSGFEKIILLIEGKKDVNGKESIKHKEIFKLICNYNSTVFNLHLENQESFSGMNSELLSILKFPVLDVVPADEEAKCKGEIAEYFANLEFCVEIVNDYLNVNISSNEVFENFYDKGKDDKYKFSSEDGSNLTKKSENYGTKIEKNSDYIFDEKKIDEIFDQYEDESRDTILDRTCLFYYGPIIKQLEDRVLNPKYLFYNGEFFKPRYWYPLLEVTTRFNLVDILCPSKDITPNYSEYSKYKYASPDVYHFSYKEDDKYYDFFKKFVEDVNNIPKSNITNESVIMQSSENSNPDADFSKLYNFYKYFKSRNNIDIFFARDFSEYGSKKDIEEDLNEGADNVYPIYSYIFFKICSNLHNLDLGIDFIFRYILEPFQKYKDMKDLLSNFSKSYPDLLDMVKSSDKAIANDYYLYSIFKNKEFKLNWIKKYQSFHWNCVSKKYLPLCRNMLFENINNLYDILNAVDLVLMYFKFKTCISDDEAWDIIESYNEMFSNYGKFSVEDLMEYLKSLKSYCSMWYDTFSVLYYYLTPVYVDDLVDYMKEYVESKSLNGVTRTLYQLVGTEFNFYDFYSDNEIKNLITKDLQDLQSKLEKNPNFDVVSYAKGEITTKLKSYLLSKINKAYEEASTKKPEKISKEALETFYNNCKFAFNKSSFIEGLDKAIEERLIQYFREFVPVVLESNNVSDITYTDSGDENLFDDKFVLGDPMFKEIISSVKRTPEYNSCVDQLNFLEDFVQLVQCEANFKVFDVAYSYIIDNLKKSKGDSHSNELLSYCKGLNLDDLQSNTNLPICILLDNINYTVLKCYHFYNFKKSDKVKEKYDYLFKKIEDSKQKLVKLKELANKL